MMQKTWNARDQTRKENHGRNRKHKKLQKKENNNGKPQ